MNTCETCRYYMASPLEEPCDSCRWDGVIGQYPTNWEAPTNADRIRDMTDEELAEWFLREPTIGPFAFCPPGTGDDCPTSPCEQCWLDWIKTPVEKGSD